MPSSLASNSGQQLDSLVPGHLVLALFVYALA